MARAMCPYCWEGGDKRTLERDHIIPKSRIGVECNCKPNMVWAHRNCNRRKKDKTPLEYFVWLQDIGHFDYWGFHHATRRKLLEELVELEFKARRHLKEAHGVRLSFEEK